MKPAVSEFKDDVALKQEIDRLADKGVSKKQLYVMSHDDDRTERVADSISAGKLGEGFSTEEGNVYNKKRGRASWSTERTRTFPRRGKQLGKQIRSWYDPFD